MWVLLWFWTIFHMPMQLHIRGLANNKISCLAYALIQKLPVSSPSCTMLCFPSEHRLQPNCRDLKQVQKILQAFYSTIFHIHRHFPMKICHNIAMSCTVEWSLTTRGGTVCGRVPVSVTSTTQSRSAPQTHLLHSASLRKNSVKYSTTWSSSKGPLIE